MSIRNSETEDETSRSDGQLWECWICKQKLSRRQRLESHLHVIHGLTEYQCKKRYKLYTIDGEVPVPRATQWRKNLVDNQTPDTSSQISSSNENGPINEDPIQVDLPLQGAAFCVDQPFTYEVEKLSCESSSENESSDNESSYDDIPTCINELESDDDNVCYDGAPVENAAPPIATKLTDLQERCLSIWAYVIKHRLTALALNDALTLFPLVSGVDTSKIKLKDMNTFLENVDIKIHDVCENCDNLFPDDENIFTCSTSGCQSLRYKGSISSQHKQNHKVYFATLSVEQQLIEIMSRREIWEKMESYMCKAQQNNSIITDIQDGEAYKHVLISNNDARHTFTLSMNTDGALLYSSSHVDLWPVFLIINELPPKLRYSRINMITWGLWQTATKPNFSTYLMPLCQELISLKENGFNLLLPSGVKHCKAILVMAIVDLMAKAPLLGMAYHNGSYGCSSCEEPGEIVKSGKGTARSYPPRDSYSLRNTSKFADTARKVVTTGTEELGIRTLSPLLSLAYFDIVNGVVPDYMHGILLGITKKLISLWTKSKYSKSRFYIGNKVHILEDRLRDMMPNDYIQRMPRKFKHSWKASEYQVWLLYFGLPSLDGILPSEYYDHFAMFVSAIYKLLADTISEADLKCAEQELQEFYMKMPVLYGFEQCGLNVHNAGAHLCSYVRMWGPLWAWSCFSYEDMNGNVLSRVHGTGNVTIQALKMLQMQKILRTTYPSMRNIQLQSFVAETLRSSKMPRKLTEVDVCSIAGGLQKTTIPLSILDQLNHHISGAETSSFLKALRVFKCGHVFFCSEYSHMEKRICNIVLITEDSVPVIGAIKYFLLHKDSGKCFAVYNAMEIDDTKQFLSEKASHLIRLKESRSIDYVIPISKVTEKLMYVKCSDCYCISRMPNFYGLTI